MKVRKYKEKFKNKGNKDKKLNVEKKGNKERIRVGRRKWVFFFLII